MGLASEANPPEVSTDMNLHQDSSSTGAKLEVVSRAEGSSPRSSESETVALGFGSMRKDRDGSLPQDSSSTGAKLEVASSAGDTSRSSSESETVALSFGSMLKAPTGEGKMVWDSRANYIVFGLRFLGCQVRSIYSVLRSYGFRCSIRDVKHCVRRYKLRKHDTVAHPVNGLTVRNETSKSGMECTWTAKYVRGRPKVMIVNHAMLRARTPEFGQLLSTAEGDQITVEATQGRLQMRALNRRPAPKRKVFTAACRAAYQNHPETLE